ncbi:PREDICTED: centlein, partial [Chaetura pelagica]|uniref:centlein n=1 Tax=Chaetura pelagica TaxID=8897 RepID=UPI000523A839
MHGSTPVMKELQELQNLYKQNIEHTAEQAELIKQLQALNSDTQKVLEDQEDTHTAETSSYQKLYNELTLCFETLKTSEIQLQKTCSSLQDQLLEKDRKISQLEEQLQKAYGALYGVHHVSSPKCEVQEPPVKRSRSLSPKSSFRESEETRETDELRAAHEKRKERLQMLQTNYRALKEQLKQWEECDSRIESGKSTYQHTDPCQLCEDGCDAGWNELAFFKREHKKLLIEKLNLEEELDQMKVCQSVEPPFKLSEDDGLKNSTPKKNMKEISHQRLRKVQQLERRFKAIEGELKKEKEVNKDLLKEKNYLEASLKVKKEDADTRERELEMLHKRICEIKKDKVQLQLVIDEQRKEAASLKRQVVEANWLRNENEDLLSQVQELKCLLDEAKAVATSGQCNCKITDTKVKLKTAKKKSSLGHHGAFLKQSIKVMSNVCENFSKDGWEDVSESSDSEISASESLETLIMKTGQNTDPVQDRSKQRRKKQIQDSQNPCNVVCLEDKKTQYNKKGHSQNKDLDKLHSKRKKICCLIKSYPSFLSQVNRTKRKNTIIQKPGCSVTLLQERIKSLQQQITVLQNEKKTAVSSLKGFKEINETLTTQLHLADQRLQTSKRTIE